MARFIAILTAIVSLLQRVMDAADRERRTQEQAMAQASADLRRADPGAWMDSHFGGVLPEDRATAPDADQAARGGDSDAR